MSTLAAPLLAAVYQKLAPSPRLAALGATVYDEPPETAPTPYVLLGEVDEQADEAHDRAGITAELTLHVWSRYRGYQEAARIVEALDAELHRQPLTLDGWQKVSISARRHRYTRDPDPELRHAVTTFRVWAERTPEPTHAEE